MGPLGIKKAEQDLIKRRYNQHNYQYPLQSSNSQCVLNTDILPVTGGPQRELSQQLPAGNYARGYKHSKQQYPDTRNSKNPYIKFAREIYRR